MPTVSLTAADIKMLLTPSSKSEKACAWKEILLATAEGVSASEFALVRFKTKPN